MHNEIDICLLCKFSLFLIYGKVLFWENFKRGGGASEETSAKSREIPENLGKFYDISEDSRKSREI